jgi:hypothetical protein
MGIEPTSSAWKAEVLPLNYTRNSFYPPVVVEGAGFEPAKAEPSDLQSDPFDRSGTPPQENSVVFCNMNNTMSTKLYEFFIFCSMNLNNLSHLNLYPPYQQDHLPP